MRGVGYRQLRRLRTPAAAWKLLLYFGLLLLFADVLFFFETFLNPNRLDSVWPGLFILFFFKSYLNLI